MGGTAGAGVANLPSIGLSTHQSIQNDIAEDHLYRCQEQLRQLGEELIKHLRSGNTVDIAELEKTVKALQDGLVQLRLRRAEAEDAGQDLAEIEGRIAVLQSQIGDAIVLHSTDSLVVSEVSSEE
jgi:uncharacterized protein YhaN